MYKGMYKTCCKICKLYTYHQIHMENEKKTTSSSQFVQFYAHVFTYDILYSWLERSTTILKAVCSSPAEDLYVRQVYGKPSRS